MLARYPPYLKKYSLIIITRDHFVVRLYKNATFFTVA